jgi:large subunit ribosomal protein L13
VQTTYAPRARDVQHGWFVIDAEGVVLGRLATRVATVLSGKHRPTYAPYLDTGDYVVVVNAAKVRLTGHKLQDKRRYWHSGYRGGLKSVPYDEFLAKDPEGVIRKAVRGMLPKTPMGRAMLKKLKVYRGPEHPHAAQGPAVLSVQP